MLHLSKHDINDNQTDLDKAGNTKILEALQLKYTTWVA